MDFLAISTPPGNQRWKVIGVDIGLLYGPICVHVCSVSFAELSWPVPIRAEKYAWCETTSTPHARCQSHVIAK
jgi:hypothetical protein